MSKILIIGGVAAGAGCAARLRRLDERSQIIMLERGEYISYANCGLPYHVGDVIQSRDALLVTPVQVMRERFNVDVRIRNEALAIDRENKTVRIKNHVSGEEYTESYDKLVIATGSSPLRPRIPGIDSPRILTLWTVPDTDHIRSMIREHGAKRAVVVGGGFIGLEMAENLHHAGLSVSIVEATDQVMAPVDPEMAAVLHENIRSNGVGLHLSDGVASFEDKGSVVDVKLSSGKILTADIVILSIGVRANSQIAKEAGLELNARGGIIVNDHLQTSDPDIYAAGDVIEVEDFIFKDRTMVPLAGPANKQGRIAADNIAGIPSAYKGTQGSSVAQIFDLTAASTGANEKTLIRRGLVRGKDYTSILISQGSHAGYYPGAVQMIIKLLFLISQGSHAGYYPGAVQMLIKLLFSMNGAKIFGAQIIGPDGVDKRIDTIGTAIRLGAGVVDLKDLELAYAPPFSSAKDPVNMAGFTAENVLKGLACFSDWKIPEDGVILDIREEAETLAYALPDAVHIPLGQLRARLSELDRSTRYIVFCQGGVRSYNAARILMQHGFGKTEIYPGGTSFYPESEAAPSEPAPPKAAPLKAAPLKAAPLKAAPSKDAAQKAAPRKAAPQSVAPQSVAPQSVKKVTIHCDGMQCPGPIMEVFRSIKEMEDGQLLEVTASDPGFTKDIESWCRRTGNTLISSGKKGRSWCRSPLLRAAPGQDDHRLRRRPRQSTCLLRHRKRRAGYGTPGHNVLHFLGAYSAPQVRQEQKDPQVPCREDVRNNAAARHDRTGPLPHEHGRHGHKDDARDHER